MITQTETTLYRLANLDAEQKRVTYQTSTGRQIDNGSEDSALHQREIFVDDRIRTYTGIQKQIERTTAQNSASDSAMAEIKTLFDFVKVELIKANTDTTSDAGLKAIAVNVEGVKENLYDLANTQIEGEYVFSGSNSSVQAFSKDSDGNITYTGDNEARRIAVEDGSYRDRGINGFDMMMYNVDTAGTGGTLTFEADNRIIDQDGYEWELDGTSTNLVKRDADGELTGDTLSVTSDGGTPATYTTAIIGDGERFEAKKNIFDALDETINALNKVDSGGVNPIDDDLARTILGEGQNMIDLASDQINVAHAELGAKNKVFELANEKISSKLTQYTILSQEIGGVDLATAAVEAKALELTYTALYSTISKTNELSLVNFIN